jgi:hypothetical protein
MGKLTKPKKELNVGKLIDEYFQLQQEDKIITKRLEEIKVILKESIEKEHKTKNAIAKKIIQDRSTWNNDKLMSTLKDNIKNSKLLDEIIKSKEYVDMDVLQEKVEEELIDPSMLKECLINKEVITLRVDPIKKKEEK